MEQASIKTVTARKPHICDWCLEEITEGSQYERSALFYDGTAVTWRNHPYCMEIASKLKWFAECDEGLSPDDFRESVKYEYMEIMSNHHTEEYESETFVYPSFAEQLQFIIKHHSL